MALREKILAQLATGPKSNADLRKVLFPEAATYVRELDSELQKMRRDGVAAPGGKGKWVASTMGVCKACGGKGYV